MTTVEANGVRLGVEHFGDASVPLCLLAGGTTMLSWPDALCAALARGGRHVVRYDLRDSGASTTVDPEAPAYTLRDLAADAAALARALDDEPAHLAGIGVGGMVAQVAAQEYPDAFSALTLAGTRPVAPGPPDDDLPDHDAATMGRLFSRPMPDWSDRAAVAEFAAAGAAILGNDPAPARATAERIWDRTPGTEPAVQMANQLGMVFSKLDCKPRWRERLPSSLSRRSWSTDVGTGSSLSATARRSRARSPARGCSCSRRPRPRSPRHRPARSPGQCSRSRDEPTALRAGRPACRRGNPRRHTRSAEQGHRCQATAGCAVRPVRRSVVVTGPYDGMPHATAHRACVGRRAGLPPPSGSRLRTAVNTSGAVSSDGVGSLSPGRR